MSDFTSTIIAIKREYGNHPCGQRFCRVCKFPLLPPAYPGDYWDCNECGRSIAPTASQITQMTNPVLVARITEKRTNY